MCYILDDLIFLGEIQKWQRCQDRFVYYDSCQQPHSYNPDFKVWETSSKFFYLEVKGYVREIDHWKWKAMPRDKFVVAFQEDLIELEQILKINPLVICPTKSGRKL